MGVDQYYFLFVSESRFTVMLYGDAVMYVYRFSDDMCGISDDAQTC